MDPKFTKLNRSCHGVALAAALFALPLLISGAQVTTNRVGMAVPDWPTTFGVNMFLYNFFLAPLGVVIEHRHRLFGSALGIASIFLALWFVVFDRRVWIKFLGLGVLLAVSVQGVLGGIRVLRNSTTFAAIHGCTGQAVFALLVSLCVVTSRDWFVSDRPRADIHHLRRKSLVTLALIYAQMVIGATLRHFGANLVLHAIMASVVWGHCAVLVWRIERNKLDAPSLATPARWMALAVTLQVLLGMGAWWLLRPFDGVARDVSLTQAFFRSSHVVNGALLLGSSMVLTLRAYRHLTTPIPNVLLAPTTRSLPQEALA